MFEMDAKDRTGVVDCRLRLRIENQCEAASGDGVAGAVIEIAS